MLSPVVARALNRLIAADESAATALRAHAGQTAVFVLEPLEVALAVTADGTLRQAEADALPDLRVSLTLPSALRVLAGDVPAAAIVRMEGDATFAATVRQLYARLRWDAEEDLSKIVGDIVAHRVAEGGRNLNAWGRDAVGRLSQGAAEYVTEEARMLPPRAEVEAWYTDVDQVRDAAGRLEKRLTLLEARGTDPKR